MNWAPHPFTLRQLQYVVAVAELLSFRRAAERCHVSQPSLSAQILQLEAALGVQLFERDRRRVLPTAAGSVVIDRARELLLLADDLGHAAKQASNPLEGELRIGVIPTISPYLLPKVAPALRKAFPKLRVKWTEDRTPNVSRALHAGELDAAIVALEAELGDVEVEELAKDPFVIATAPGNPLGEKKTPANAAELRQADMLLLDEGHCFGEQAVAFCSKAKAHELEYRATSLSTLAQMVASGAGVTLLPELAVATEASRAGLRVRPFVAPGPARTVVLVWRKRSPISGALRELAAVLRRAYPRLRS